ncbi:MAG: D-lyxose/D-mannose family sugar isomerase [Verrucomicrobiota bacterium]|nr:D-lyxose/D-mannose family sugar isomerase [Verrucomicrobiota bacterium]
MKRSEINAAFLAASAFFKEHHWMLPPNPRWDITDFGLGDFNNFGLILINLAEEPEYCEKLMYCAKGQTTPAHMHKQKKEDIICRNGEMAIRFWPRLPDECTPQDTLVIQWCGQPRTVRAGEDLILAAGERVTITPDIYHAFHGHSAQVIIGEVSTANDDAHDNYFVRTDIGRFPEIVEDAAPLVRLISEPNRELPAR